MAPYPDDQSVPFGGLAKRRLGDAERVGSFGNGEQAAHQSVDVSSPSARSIRASRALTPREGAGVTSGGAS